MGTVSARQRAMVFWAAFVLTLGLIGLGAATVAVAPADAATSVAAAPEGAQSGDSSGADEPFDGRSTEDTVRVVVGALLGIAVLTFVGMVVFIWHTSPRRRQRVAKKRLESRVARPEFLLAERFELTGGETTPGERNDDVDSDGSAEESNVSDAAVGAATDPVGEKLSRARE